MEGHQGVGTQGHSLLLPNMDTPIHAICKKMRAQKTAEYQWAWKAELLLGCVANSNMWHIQQKVGHEKMLS